MYSLYFIAVKFGGLFIMDINKIQLHNINLKEFLDAIDHCKGDVFLETEEGDSLNLKSKLCQFAGLVNIINGAFIAEATIRCSNPEDEQKLFRFNLYKEIPETK